MSAGLNTGNLPARFDALTNQFALGAVNPLRVSHALQVSTRGLHICISIPYSAAKKPQAQRQVGYNDTFPSKRRIMRSQLEVASGSMLLMVVVCLIMAEGEVARTTSTVQYCRKSKGPDLQGHRHGDCQHF